jgi:hypothetical protein
MKIRGWRAVIVSLLTTLGVGAGVALAVPAEAVEQRVKLINSYGEARFSGSTRAGTVRININAVDYANGDWPWGLYAFATAVRDEVAVDHRYWYSSYDGQTTAFTVRFPSDVDRVTVGICGYIERNDPVVGPWKELAECSRGGRIYPT